MLCYVSIERKWQGNDNLGPSASLGSWQTWWRTSLDDDFIGEEGDHYDQFDDVVSDRVAEVVRPVVTFNAGLST